MEILKYCKMQIGFLLIFFFVSYLFIKDGNKLNRKMKIRNCNRYFDVLFVLGEMALAFDALTSYTVNHLQQVPAIINQISHLAFLLTYQLFIFIHFMYWLSITESFPRKLWKKICCYGPIVISVIVTIVTMPKLYYKIGTYTNYSMGIPAYACYGAIVLYSILTMIVFGVRTNYIRKNRKTAFIMALIAVCAITLVQMIFKETLVSGIAVILVVLSIYLCMENPTIKYLEIYHNEMVMGFATLVESKDGSTGGHIRRSSAYAELIAQELRKNQKYQKRITTDYIDNLKKAAPMHDVGKIGVPDSILQKPGKLTEEEFAIMKKHPEIGGKIIEETFGHLDDDDYENMAYKVAMYHHEKWNGKGYPSGKSGQEIPLCARIMAVADVFDAVSAKRCYRDAMPLEQCYRIIQEGRGEDFDPDVVDAFFKRQMEVEQIYHTMQE